jgi:hypothetical protein
MLIMLVPGSTVPLLYYKGYHGMGPRVTKFVGDYDKMLGSANVPGRVYLTVRHCNLQFIKKFR